MQQFNIDISNPIGPLVLHTMQGDAMSRFFEVTVTDDGAAYEAPADAIYTVRFGGAPGMPSGWYDTITEVGGSSRPAVVVDENTYTVEIAEQALGSPGTNGLVLIISDATGYTLASWAFELSVQPTPGLEAPAVTTYYNLLAQQVAQVIASTGEAASSAAAAAQSATAAQNSATSAAQSQSAAAKSASTAQTAAQSAQQSATRAAASESAAAQSATSAAEDASSAASDAQSAASDASAASQSATAAQTAATSAQQSAANAAASAEAAAQSAQQADGFRSFFGGAVLPAPTTGTLDPSRPMQSAATASVTATSRGDFIHGVTVNGFTTQAGTGDPSPSNVRALTSGGIRLKKYAVTGKEPRWQKNDGADNNGNYLYFLAGFGAAVGSECICNRLKYYSTTFQTTPSVGISPAGSLYMNIGSAGGSLASFKKALNDAYSSGNPYIVWYVPADEADATGLYAPIILTSGEYRATCLPLTAPLCEGDSVVSKTKSGCDKQLTLDGSTLTVAASGSNYTVVAANAVAGGTVYASGLAGLSLTAGSVTIPGTAFPSSVTSAEQANTWLQSNPQTLYYQSTAYTDADDIAVLLESHAQAVLVLDGTEPGSINPVGGYISIPLSASAMPFMAQGGKNSGISSVAKAQYASAGSGFYWITNSRNLIFGKAYADQFDNYAAFQAKMAELYSAGTPAQFVYPLTTPAVYAHPAVDIVAVPDDTGSYTVSSQDGTTVVVAFGGFASEAQGKKADAAVQTVNGQQGPSVTLLPQDVGGISTYTCSTSGKVHTLTGSGDNIKFVADAAYTAGNTIKVNGTTVTAQTQDGTALATGAWAKGATVVCWRNGTKLTVGGSKAYTPPAYSTSETATGETWIDGKPVYRKVYTGGTLNKSTIDLGVNTQIDSILRADFVVVNSTGNQITNPGGFINNVLTAENAWTCSVNFKMSTSALTAIVTAGASPALTGWTIMLHYTKK